MHFRHRKTAGYNLHVESKKKKKIIEFIETELKMVVRG